MPVLLAAAGGAAVALAIRELARGLPGALGYVETAAAALVRVGREGRSPSEGERRRLGILAGLLIGGAALLLAGPGPIALLAAAGPGLAGWAIDRRQRRYRRAIEADVPAIATAIADALSAGGSLRGALTDAGTALEGPTAVELARVGADLELGLSVREALGSLAERVDSEPVAALVAATLSQQRSGGDLAALLRRHARAAAERARAEADARAATAQARLTGGMVVAMPLGVALLVELLAPGFLGTILADPAAIVMLLAAAALQLAGFVVIRRLGRVER